MSEPKVYKDFPIKGVNFIDVCEWFSHPENLYNVAATISSKYIRPDYVVGIESRGFIVATAYSTAQNIPMLCARKKGKLPGDTVSEEYQKEYGTDVIEMQSIDLTNKRVLIVDDVKATGGTIEAVTKLCKKLGASDIDTFTVFTV